jgi:hypothetical protein
VNFGSSLLADLTGFPHLRRRRQRRGLAGGQSALRRPGRAAGVEVEIEIEIALHHILLEARPLASRKRWYAINSRKARTS